MQWLLYEADFDASGKRKKCPTLDHQLYLNCGMLCLWQGVVMIKDEFESAVMKAVLADSKAGNKWKPLETLFGADGVRGGGALNNDPAERKTRIRQLLTRRKHPTFTGEGYSRHCVLVLNRDAANKLNNHDYLQDYVVRDLLSERPALPAAMVMETVIVLRIDQDEVLPVALLYCEESSRTEQYQQWYPGIKMIPFIAPKGDHGDDESQSEEDESESESGELLGRNLVYFGPPGTGKSYHVDLALEDYDAFVRCVFHPDFGYGDFVGIYKPVVGSDPSQTIVGADGKGRPMPVVYYDFEPGPFALALVMAKEHFPRPVALVIDEINRGDCAAIFGDCFQLLDRSDVGSSQYGIKTSLPFGRYLAENKVLESVDAELFLPANLCLLATMNTADQSLYPMDSAFKRRWEWVPVPIAYDSPALAGIVLEGDATEPDLSWVDIIQRINNAIVKAGLNGDKRIGPWYLKPKAGKIIRSDVRDKLLFYLWHDVFRGREQLVFNPAIGTYDDARSKFNNDGLRDVLAPLFFELLSEDGVDAEMEEAVATGNAMP
jgi:hypothetical protein